MAIEGKDPHRQDQGLAPERIEPDLTPAPGTPRPGASGGKSDEAELGFDPDSPDLKDPQIDPMHPAKAPSGPAGNTEKRAKGDSYPPYGGSKG